MRNHNSEITTRHAALTSGISILVMTVAAVFATDVSIGSLLVPDDASATLINIKSSGMLFRLGVLSWLVILITDILAAWGLYIFLVPVNKSISLLAGWFRLIYAAMLGAAIFNLINVLLLLNSGEQLNAAGFEQLPAQVVFYVNSFYSTWSFALIIFGFHILFIGYLIYRSDYVPKIFGIILMFAFIGYLSVNIFKLLIPQFESFISIVEYIFILPMLGEVALGVWLVWKGKDVV